MVHHKYMCVCVYVCVYACVRACVCVCACVCVLLTAASSYQDCICDRLKPSGIKDPLWITDQYTVSLPQLAEVLGHCSIRVQLDHEMYGVMSAMVLWPTVCPQPVQCLDRSVTSLYLMT